MSKEQADIEQVRPCAALWPLRTVRMRAGVADVYVCSQVRQMTAMLQAQEFLTVRAACFATAPRLLQPRHQLRSHEL